MFISVSFWGAELLLELPGGTGLADTEKQAHPSSALAWVAFHPRCFYGISSLLQLCSDSFQKPPALDDLGLP